MEISFDQNFGALLVLLSVILAAGISYMLYFRNSGNPSLTIIQRVFLSILRFLALFLIFLFLISPLIENTRKIKQLPILAIAIDNSQSVKSYSSDFETFIQDIKKRFSKKYQLEFWSFGEKAENAEIFTGNDRRSDYGQLLHSVKENYTNKNIGALILLGDGIYNQGQNPLNYLSALKFPIYTLGLGDTIRKTDAAITKVKTNKVAFLKNKFPVEIELKFDKLKGKIAYVDIENDKKLVYSSTVAIGTEDEYKLEFAYLEATKAGLQHYKVHVQPFDGEVNLKNNEYEFVIQVLENKQKILMLSDGPHPDLGAIRTSLSELQNYETKVFTGNDVPDSLSSYSLIILNQLPSLKNASTTLLSKICASRIPVLFIVGPNTLTEQFNSLETGLSISASKNMEEVQGIFDSKFSLFTLSAETKEIIENFPPLVAPFGNTTRSANIQNLAFQTTRNIPTGKTLLAFGSNSSRKVGFIIGEGLWRWRLFDFQSTGNQDAFNELVQKIIQYLALKENEDNFNVFHQSLYQETDKVELTAELYNDSYELINSPDVNIKIKNDSLKEFNYIFDRTDNYYRLNAGNFEPGDYTFEATTKLGDQNFIENGNFSVVRNDVETQNNRADFDVLYQLAEQSGGQFSTFANYGTLLDKVSANKQITVQQYKQTTQAELINMKLFFLLLIVLLGAEWFFRKYWGTY